MKCVILFALLALSFAQAQRNFRSDPWRIIRSESDGPNEDGSFRYEFETENEIQEGRQGDVGSEGQINMSGSFRFPLPDGTIVQVNYVADEGGFRAESPILPQAPALPAHAIRQIEFAERQRAEGVVFDNNGFVVNRNTNTRFN